MDRADGPDRVVEVVGYNCRTVKQVCVCVNGTERTEAKFLFYDSADEDSARVGQRTAAAG